MIHDSRTHFNVSKPPMLARMSLDAAPAPHVGDAVKALRALGPYLRPYRLALVPVLLGLLVDVAFDGFWPLGFKFLIDDALVPHNGRLLVLILAGLGGGVLVAAVAQAAYDHRYAQVCASVLADLRLRMLDHLQSLSLGFYSRTSTGEILSRFSGDLVAGESALAAAPAWAAKPGLDILVSSALLFVLDWRLAAGAMLIWPVALLGPRLLAPRAIAASNEKKQLEARALAVVEETVSGLPVVKAFGLEGARLDAFRRPVAGLREAAARVAFAGSLVERTAVGAVLVFGIGVIGVAAWMTFDGLMSIGTLVAFQSLFFTLGYSIAELTRYVPALVQGVSGLQHITEILDEEPEVVDAPGAAPLPRLADAIAFRDVGYAYPGAAAPALSGFSAEVPRGARVALVGSSGSGKSTALGLLLRLYDPESGSVAIDGRDLRTVTQASLRAQMAIVYQESFLFDATIRENIRFGRPDATDAEVEAAARAAEIHEFVVGCPDGYETVVGERGGRLSGGQRQRIAIARAVVRDPAILLLDEATAALDPATEAAVNATLARLGESRTVISVTHRLAAAKEAGRILVIDRGRLAESGTHSELLAADGIYARLWEQQSGFVVSGDGDRAAVEPERLARVPILGGLDAALLDDLAGRFASEQVPAGRRVIAEGDPGDRFYLVVRGRLAVTRLDSAGAELRVGVLQDGDYFGEIALLRRVPRVASVTAELPSLLLSLAREHFLELVERAPGLRDALEGVADDRLAQTLRDP
jgi:ATP-binding cassette subfamily B protein